MAEFQKDATDAVDKKLTGSPPSAEAEMPALIAEVVKENGWEDCERDVLGRFFGMDLFDLQKTTTLPRRLLGELTWSPGEEAEFFE